MPKQSAKIHDSDQQLWSNFKAGDQDAYTTIIQRYFTPMFIYAIRLSKDQDFVKDCIQDVFYNLWKRRENISHA
ncbi:RNA polymerase sigma factor [Daejeonella sp.]|uniref:RNA polymerase sigma factor n=1 Tax=Daejeonella sp. TaxID=2805397 RepID=UPI003982E656